MKFYLGDLVYAEWNGHSVILTTLPVGTFDRPQRIVLEATVYECLVKFVNANANPAYSGGEQQRD